MEEDRKNIITFVNMKNTMQKFLLLLFFCGMAASFAQKPPAVQSIWDFQKAMNAKFNNPEKSPLTVEDRMEFKKLDFFDIDTSFTITAQFIRTPSEAPFLMPTTTERRPVYVKYGEAHFTMKGKKVKLNLYQNQELTQDPEYVDYLFLPFTDLTNGDSSYGGGRYIDIRIPPGDSLVIDFNKAYNPYCAYNGKYSCPIPPAENYLGIAITAGEKKFKDKN